MDEIALSVGIKMDEEVPKTTGTVISYLVLVFMVWNVMVSGLALGRYSERAQGIPAKNQAESWIDEQFPDQKMEQIYPNAKMTGTKKE